VSELFEKPLDILQIAAFPFPSPQGSQVYVRGMLRALGRRGHRVRLLCYAHGQGEIDPEYEVIRAPAVRGYDNLRAGPDRVKPFLDLALVAMAARRPAQIVHAHNYEALLVALLARPGHRAPVVYSAHTALGEELPTYVEGRRAQAVAGWLGARLDRHLPRRAEHSVALSERAQALLFDWGCAEVALLPPGVEPEDVAPCAPAALPPGDPWVIYTGNPDRYQELDVLLAAMAQVPEARLLLVSSSPLDAFAGALPGDRLRCVTTPDFGEVRSLIAASALGAIPRGTCAGYPIKLLNLLGMGLPTVVCEGSHRDLPGAVQVPNRDPAAMAAAIRRLLANPAERAALGAAAAAHVQARCTWAAQAARLEALYRTLL